MGRGVNVRVKKKKSNYVYVKGVNMYVGGLGLTPLNWKLRRPYTEPHPPLAQDLRRNYSPSSPIQIKNRNYSIRFLPWSVNETTPKLSAGIFKQSMGDRNQVGIGLSYRAASAELEFFKAYEG